MNQGALAGFKKIGPIAMILALVGAGLCAAGYFQDRQAFLPSYLFGFSFWVALTLGCFGFTLLHHTIRGAWGLSVLRLFEAGGGGAMFLAMGVLSLPILFGLHDLYPWTNSELVQGSLQLQRKAWYLNDTFFVIRTVAYFTIWGLVAYTLRRSSLKQDETKDDSLYAKRTTLSAPMIIVFVVSITLAATDWTMSLDPHWFSTIYGVIYMIGGGLAAISLVNILVMRNADKAPYNEVVNGKLNTDLGNLMMVFTLLWTYTSLSQFLIIWSGNLPEFITFVRARSMPGWNEMALFLIVGNFIAPFLILLAPRVKAVPKLLGGLAIYIFAARFVDTFWTIMPFVRKSCTVTWMDAAAVLFFGAVWFAVFSKQVQIGSLIPSHDPRLKEVYEHA